MSVLRQVYYPVQIKTNFPFCSPWHSWSAILHAQYRQSWKIKFTTTLLCFLGMPWGWRCVQHFISSQELNCKNFGNLGWQFCDMWLYLMYTSTVAKWAQLSSKIYNMKVQTAALIVYYKFWNCFVVLLSDQVDISAANRKPAMSLFLIDIVFTLLTCSSQD